MRKLLCFALALCLVLGLCGCQIITREIIGMDGGSHDDTEGFVTDEALYEHGMELGELLEEMLRSPEYFDLMGGSDRLSEVIIPLMRADLSEPESAYIVELSPDALPLLMSAAEADLDSIPGGLRDFIERRMISSVPSIINSQQGAETLAAASILTVSGAWPDGELEAGRYLILNYPYVCPVMVSFCGENGVVSGTATMLIGSALEEDTMDGVYELFGYLGIDGMDIRKLDTDKEN